MRHLVRGAVKGFAQSGDRHYEKLRLMFALLKHFGMLGRHDGSFPLIL
jgi:hypothetical protein